METRRSKTISGDKFSFLSMGQDSDFEFGSLTCSPNSPADHLFFNGRLLPHSFPIPIQPTNITNGSFSRSTSRASSKDSSSMSSRSNSSSSRSSSCSTSARTSTSEASSEQRRPLNRASKVAIKAPVKREMIQQYGSSKRWQFIAPAPALNHQVSRRRKAEIVVKEGGDRSVERVVGCGRRFFRSVVSACKECHAIKPSTRDVELQ